MTTTNERRLEFEKIGIQSENRELKIKEIQLRRIIFFQLAILCLLGYLWSVDVRGMLPDWMELYSLAYKCSLIGSLGGVVYCLRAVYLNRCVKGRWNSDWNVWYYLRPIVSGIVGLVAFVFLNAGLLVLDAPSEGYSSPYGFLALSFIAGLNVDRFLVKLEEIAKASWGVRPSRASEESLENREK